MRTTHPRLRHTAALLLLIIGTSLSRAAYSGQGVWTSGGPRDGGSINALAVSPASPSTLYAGCFGSGGGVFRSADSGGTWATASAGVNGLDIAALAVDPSAPSTLYAGTRGVFRSTDSGGSWAAASGGLPPSLYVSALAINPTTPTTLYAAAVDAIFKSTDAGGSWAILPPTSGFYFYYSALAINPSNPATLYAGRGGGDGGVIKSTDSGATWATASTGITAPLVTALAIDPATPSTLYAGTFDRGVFRSTDSGATWAATSNGLPNFWVSSLAVNPARPSTLYAGTVGGGVFGSTDSGRTWYAINSGLPDLFVRTLALDPTGGTTLYAGLSSGTVWQLSSPRAGSLLLPTSAHSSGANGAFYTTNVSVSNTGPAPLSFTMKFLGNNQDGSGGPEQTFNLDAGRSVTYFDVLGSVFSLTSGFGAIRITSSTSTLNVVSVTSTSGFGGTLSQTIPAIPSSDLIPAGSPRSILYIREGDGFRTNLILASNAGVSTAVDAVLVSPEGETLAAKSYSVPPNGMTQIDRVVRDMGVRGPVTGARLVLSSPAPYAAFAALATVIDETTNDSTALDAR